MRVLQFISVSFLIACQSLLLIGDEPDFNRDVRPILSDRCFFCHGPDGENRQADLRLDTFDGSRDVIESGQLVQRILAADPGERMPPPDSKLSLSDEEKEILKSWADHGAEYKNHWAFEPLATTVPIPDSDRSDWSKQSLDRFVADALFRQGLRPAVEAQPLRWLRRVTLDLTGLPPTIEEMEEFLKALDQSNERDAVYGNVVDRLLASPGYGEHMAVAWLDAARYADSYGYQSDRLNSQWPYRDWVVKAFNDNLPYDRFLTWQLAGDLLESSTREHRLATAFNRIHRLNNEGGAVFEEWRIENVADRVQTFSTVILGLTLECCRCHDHKYDPIPMRDFYSMSAFFNSIDENGVYDNSEKVPAPSLLLPTDEQTAKLDQTRKKMKQAEKEYVRAVDEAKLRFRQWVPEDQVLTRIPGLIRALCLDFPFADEFKEKIYFPGTDASSPTEPLAMVDVVDNPLPRMDPLDSDDGVLAMNKMDDKPSRMAVVLDGERGIVLPDIAPFDRWNPFSIAISLRESQRCVDRTVIAQSSFGQLSYNGWDLTIANGILEMRMYRDWPGNAIAVRARHSIPVNQWLQVSATYDGSSTANGLRLFVNGDLLETDTIRDGIKKSVMVKGHQSGKLTIGQRFRDRGLSGGLIDDVRVFNRELTATEIRSLATGKRIEATEDFFVSAVDEDCRNALETLTQARRAFVMAEDDVHDIPVMEEMPEGRETHVLARGEYDAPTSDETLVSRRTLTSIGPEFPPGAPLNRLGLARWATLPDHPLTSRVFVNRLWSNFFGHGLVRTPENFGLQGALPTHPDLLDWLARDFVDNDWDIKRFCRNIVLSATYRQDSRASNELLRSDPGNELLARGPSYRLSSEQIRDLALAASGLLNDRQGGPPVSPYQAGGDLWRESNTMSPAYRQSVGKDLYRRSLYSVWKRTAPLPNMLAFDAESREVCIVKRSRTNTPLQALVLMNDTQFVEAARALAERTITSDQELPDRIATAFRRLTGRYPDQGEKRMLGDLYLAETDYYRTNRPEAEELVSIGESKPPESIDPVELAAMTIVCQAIMNLDATIWKR